MTSAIDSTKPTALAPLTADVRSNFAIAASEITALQAGTVPGLAASTGSSLVGFSQSGTGAVATTEQAQLRKFTFLSDWTTTPQFNTAVQGLTDTVGLSSISFASALATDTRRLLTWSPATAGRGPFILEAYEALFSGTRDPVLSLGYNQTASGALIQSGENALSFNIEGNYNDGSGANKMEAYFQYTGSDGTTARRPFFLQINRTTNEVSSLLLSADTINFARGGALSGASMCTFTPNNFLLGSPDASANSLITVQSAAGRQSFLILQYNGLTSVQISASSLASAVISQNNVNIINLYSAPSGGSAAAAISVGVADNGAAGTFDTASASDSVASLVARAKSSQSVAAFQVQSSTSAVMFSADRLGSVVSGGLAALATTATDGFLYMPTCAGTPTGVPTAKAGKVAFVYDSTNNIIYLYNGAWKKTVALT